MGQYRDRDDMPELTLEQAKKLTRGTQVYHRWLTNADGSPQTWRVNGKVEVKKRTLDYVRVPLSRGMYKHSNIWSRSPWHLRDFSLVNGDDVHKDGDTYTATGKWSLDDKRHTFAVSSLPDFPDRVVQELTGVVGTYTDVKVWRKRDGKKRIIRRYTEPIQVIDNATV